MSIFSLVSFQLCFIFFFLNCHPCFILFRFSCVWFPLFEHLFLSFLYAHRFAQFCSSLFILILLLYRFVSSQLGFFFSNLERFFLLFRFCSLCFFFINSDPSYLFCHFCSVWFFFVNFDASFLYYFGSAQFCYFLKISDQFEGPLVTSVCANSGQTFQHDFGGAGSNFGELIRPLPGSFFRPLHVLFFRCCECPSHQFVSCFSLQPKLTTVETISMSSPTLLPETQILRICTARLAKELGLQVVLPIS